MEVWIAIATHHAITPRWLAMRKLSGTRGCGRSLSRVNPNAPSCSQLCVPAAYLTWVNVLSVVFFALIEINKLRVIKQG